MEEITKPKLRRLLAASKWEGGMLVGQDDWHRYLTWALDRLDECQKRELLLGEEEYVESSGTSGSGEARPAKSRKDPNRPYYVSGGNLYNAKGLLIGTVSLGQTKKPKTPRKGASSEVQSHGEETPR